MGGGAPLSQSPGLVEWDDRRFRHVTVLQEGFSRGSVELADDLEQGRRVVVKVLPLAWACKSHAAFAAAHPEECESPWRDISIARHLSGTGSLRCVCDFVGLFRRPAEAGDEVCLVLSYCAGGDAFSWLQRSLPAFMRTDRECLLRPLVRQVFEAVRDMHSCGIAHGGLSIERVLLEGEDGCDPEVAGVRLVNFSASTGPRASGVRGRPSYRAPEMHDGSEYDARMADAFSLGVVLFVLVVGGHPWRSTRPELCPSFGLVFRQGLAALLQRRKVRHDDGEPVPLATLLSPSLVLLLSGLLAVDPNTRLSVLAALDSSWFCNASNPPDGGRAELPAAQAAEPGPAKPAPAPGLAHDCGPDGGGMPAAGPELARREGTESLTGSPSS